MSWVASTSVHSPTERSAKSANRTGNFSPGSGSCSQSSEYSGSCAWNATVLDHVASAVELVGSAALLASRCCGGVSCTKRRTSTSTICLVACWPASPEWPAPSWPCSLVSTGSGPPAIHFGSSMIGYTCRLHTGPPSAPNGYICSYRVYPIGL